MAKNLEDLRAHLFATLEGLRDESKPLDIDRARAVADVAGVIIKTAQVEVAYMQVTGGEVGSSFLAPASRPAELSNGLHLGQIAGIRTHRMQG